MALGDVTDTVANHSYVVELLASASAANGIPSTAAHGIDTGLLSHLGKVPDVVWVGARSTAGSGTMTVTLRLWGYTGVGWVVLKALAAADTAPQTAVAIAETGADSIAYVEPVTGLAGFSRIYLEIVAIAGTTPAVTGYAIVGR